MQPERHLAGLARPQKRIHQPKHCTALPHRRHSPTGTPHLRSFLHSTVASTASSALDGVENSASPVLHEIRNIADSITVGKQIPPSSSITVVVEPGTKYEVGGND